MKKGISQWSFNIYYGIYSSWSVAIMLGEWGESSGGTGSKAMHFTVMSWFITTVLMKNISYLLSTFFYHMYNNEWIL
jgi:hypothetical protein